METQKPNFPCYICSNSEYRLLPFGYHFHERNLRGVKCTNCGLIFIHPQPNAEEIQQMYSEDYFTSSDIHLRPHGRADYLHSVVSAKEQIVYRRRLDRITQYTQKGKLLEIGCGPGHFLKAAQDAGWEVTGVEISDYAASYAREEFHLKVITGTIEQANLPAHSSDVIFMGDLLEHLTNPAVFLKTIGSLLTNQGLVYIEIPLVTNGFYARIGSILFGVLNRTKYISLPPYHLFEYNPRSISRLLSATGFKIKYFKQSTVAPSDIGLRDNALSNALKLTLQSLNYLATGVTGQFGDRLTIIAEINHKL